MIEKEDLLQISYLTTLLKGHVDSAMIAATSNNEELVTQALDAAGHLTVKLDTALWAALDQVQASR